MFVRYNQNGTRYTQQPSFSSSSAPRSSRGAGSGRKNILTMAGHRGAAPPAAMAVANRVRNPAATRDLQRQFHDSRLRLSSDERRLERAKLRAFRPETLQSVGVVSQSAVSATSGASGFDPGTKVLVLNARHVHLAPLLGDTGLSAEVVRERAARAMGHSPALTRLAHDLRERARADSRSRDGAFMTTTAHSLSLIPTSAFYANARTEAYRREWSEAGVDDRYTSGSHWCAITHPMRPIDKVTGHAYVSAPGALLSDEEIVAVWEKYTGFAQDFVLDALWALRIDKRPRQNSVPTGNDDSQDSATDTRNVLLSGSRLEEDIGEFDSPANLVGDGQSPLGKWRWAGAHKRLIHRSHPAPPVSIETAHGTVFTTFERVVITVQTETGVKVAGINRDCHHLKVVIDLHTRRLRLLPSRIRSPQFGLFADKRDSARRYHLLSQHTLVKVAYGVDHEPTLGDIKRLPIALKIATANLGATRGLRKEEEGGTPGLVMHVLGKGMPTTIVVDREAADGGTGWRADPFFTHEEGALFPTEILSFGLALRVMRLLDELQHNPAYLAMATRDWLAVLEGSPGAADGFHRSIRSPGWEERLRGFQQKGAANLRTRGAGGDTGGKEDEHALPREFYEALRALPYVAAHSAETAHLLRMLVDNNMLPALNMDALIRGVSALHTASHVDGGVIAIGFQSAGGTDLDRSSLHLTFVPVGTPLQSANNVWNPSFERIFYLDHQHRAEGDVVVPGFNMDPAAAHGPGALVFANAANADRAGSPQTQYSDYDALSMQDVLHPSHARDPYD